MIISTISFTLNFFSISFTLNFFQKFECLENPVYNNSKTFTLSHNFKTQKTFTLSHNFMRLNSDADLAAAIMALPCRRHWRWTLKTSESFTSIRLRLFYIWNITLTYVSHWFRYFYSSVPWSKFFIQTVFNHSDCFTSPVFALLCCLFTSRYVSLQCFFNHCRLYDGSTSARSAPLYQTFFQEKFRAFSRYLSILP